MKKELRSIEKINDDIKSAGKSFLGLHIEGLLNRFNELNDPLLKRKLIEEYYNNQIGFHDKKLGGTRTRINSTIRIIKAEMIVYTLKKINDSNSSVDSKSIDKAKETIRKINSGEVKLPSLDE